MLYTILIVLAFVLELLATVGVPSPSRFQLQAAGLASFFLALLVGHVAL